MNKIGFLPLIMRKKDVFPCGVTAVKEPVKDEEGCTVEKGGTHVAAFLGRGGYSKKLQGFVILRLSRSFCDGPRNSGSGIQPVYKLS